MIGIDCAAARWETRELMTIRTEILAAIEEIVAGDKSRSFKVSDVVDAMARRGSAYKRPSIRVFVASKLCGPEGSEPKPDRMLDRVGKGKYRLAAS
jgi:hypothetical protein